MGAYSTHEDPDGEMTAKADRRMEAHLKEEHMKSSENSLPRFKRHSWLAGSVTVLILTGCGFSTDHDSTSSTEKWSYQFTENGCDTGPHEYSKKEDYCLALRDDSTNKGCAPRMRGEASRKDCQSIR